jgi:polyferredoxin
MKILADGKRKRPVKMSSTGPHHWVTPTRRAVQIASLLISFPLFGYLIISGRYYTMGAILLFMIVSSVIFGRAFCSWLCPFGTLYEFSRLALRCERPRPLCRIGCPLSLLPGLMNRFSMLRVHKLEEKCIHCGACDANCPVGLIELGGGYQDFTSNPSLRYACVRCLNCVASCPAGALILTKQKSYPLECT